jgi:hypothetical protein
MPFSSVCEVGNPVNVFDGECNDQCVSGLSFESILMLTRKILAPSSTCFEEDGINSKPIAIQELEIFAYSDKAQSEKILDSWGEGG